MSLAGKRVLIARAEGQSEGPAHLLTERGAEPVVIPAIVIGPPDDEAALLSVLGRLAAFDWVVFTSANGVEHTWRALERGGLGRDAFGGARFAVVGTATGEALASRGVTAHLQAKEFRGEGVATALLEAIRAVGGSPRVLLLRAQEARDVLPEALRSAGVAVEDVAVYRTRASAEGGASIRRQLAEGAVDVVVFSSGSTVDAVCDALGESAAEALARVTVACLGPVTVTSARARGVRVDVVPPVATFASVIDALDAHFRAI